MVDKIRVLIADDHKVVRDGLRLYLGSLSQVEIVGEARDGVEAVSQTAALHPEIVLMDLIMPNMDGIEATRIIHQTTPDIRVVVLTSAAEDEKIVAAIRAGAMGYLLKDSTPQEIRTAIQEVFQGGSALPPRIATKLIQELGRPETKHTPKPSLTERETEILKLVARGISNQEIADQLVISVWTVRAHLTRILTKLHLENRTQAALYALREGLASLEV